MGENDYDAAQLLGNILNKGNASAVLPEDPMSSKMSSEKPSASKPEADDFPIHSECLSNADSEPKKKQASHLKKAS